MEEPTRHHRPAAAPAGMTMQHAHTPGSDGHDRHEGHSVAQFRTRFWVCAALTVPVIALAPGVPLVRDRLVTFPGADALLVVLSTVIYLYGAWPFLIGIVRELRQREPGMMTLVAVGVTVAYGYSVATVLGAPGMPLFFELATLVDVMLLGHWVEMRSVGQASSALESLARLVPGSAHRREADGTVADVPTADLAAGDVVLVRPGEKVPADGEIVEGSSSLDESLLTGESTPVARREGEAVIGGSLNGRGALAVRVTRTGSDTFLAQVAELVRESQASRTRTQDLADRAAMWLTVVALGSGAATFAGWTIAGAALPDAVARAVTVIVVACPHALGLAIPLVVAVSTSMAAGRGLLVRDRAAFEAARLVDTVVFDKTGTLTTGSFGVERVVSFTAATPEQVLADAAAVERWSEHPVASAIADAAGPGPRAADFLALPGEGARGVVRGREVGVLSPSALASQGVPAPAGLDGLAAGGRTVVAVVIGGAVEGAILLADTVRDSSAATVRELASLGVAVVMLTGDNPEVAARAAAQLGITSWTAQVTPAGKAERVRALRQEGRRVAMVGDGVNDAPPLAAADVGIAIGAGTDVARAAADIVLVRSDPADVVAVLRLARATYGKMRQNLAWALGYNIVAIPLASGLFAAAGLSLDPAAGAALMSASTVIVAINARLLRLPHPRR